MFVYSCIRMYLMHGGFVCSHPRSENTVYGEGAALKLPEQDGQ